VTGANVSFDADLDRILAGRADQPAPAGLARRISVRNAQLPQFAQTDPHDPPAVTRPRRWLAYAWLPAGAAIAASLVITLSGPPASSGMERAAPTSPVLVAERELAPAADKPPAPDVARRIVTRQPALAQAEAPSDAGAGQVPPAVRVDPSLAVPFLASAAGNAGAPALAQAEGAPVYGPVDEGETPAHLAVPVHQMPPRGLAIGGATPPPPAPAPTAIP